MKKINIFTAIACSLILLSGCGNNGSNEKVITVGASSTPHAEILESIKDEVAEQGYSLEIVVFDDYILPNKALTDGVLDANYFQHTPYLNSYNAANGTDIASAYLVHYEPFGIYSETVSSLSELQSGATILVPADESNETRALFLLQQEGLITLQNGATVEKGVTTLDIADSKGYNVQAIQADTVPAQLKNADEGTIAVINGNYAIQAGYLISNALAKEAASGDAAKYYANVIACRKEDKNSEKIKVLIKAINTQETKDFIVSSYNGAVQPIFSDVK